MTAVCNEGRVIRFASDRLKKERDVIDSAVNNDPLALEFVNEEYKKD